jgi:hypothetical protein
MASMASVVGLSSRAALTAAQLASRRAASSRLGCITATSSSLEPVSSNSSPTQTITNGGSSSGLRYFATSDSGGGGGDGTDKNNDNAKLHPPKNLGNFVPKRGGGDVFNRPKLSGDVSDESVTAKGSGPKPHSGQAHRQRDVKKSDRQKQKQKQSQQQSGDGSANASSANVHGRINPKLAHRKSKSSAVHDAYPGREANELIDSAATATSAGASAGADANTGRRFGQAGRGRGYGRGRGGAGGRGGGGGGRYGGRGGRGAGNYGGGQGQNRTNAKLSDIIRSGISGQGRERPGDVAKDGNRRTTAPASKLSLEPESNGLTGMFQTFVDEGMDVPKPEPPKMPTSTAPPMDQQQQYGRGGRGGRGGRMGGRGRGGRGGGFDGRGRGGRGRGGGRGGGFQSDMSDFERVSLIRGRIA